jgi:2-methylcitrate dehydratase PrpD
MYSKISVRTSSWCLVITVVNDLVSERTEEAFSHRVVIAVALATHTAQHPVFFEQRQITASLPLKI